MSYNRHIRELYSMMTRRYAPDSENMTTTEWLEKNTKLKGRPFSVSKYPYQRMMLDDDHKNTVVVKPSQTGISETYQRGGLAFLARNRNTTLIYAYPDDLMRKRNSQTRVSPLVEGNEVFNLETGGPSPVRSIDLIQVGTSFMHMTGGKTGDATSTAADAVYIDEEDLHDQAITALFSSRLQNSNFKIKKSFSTPTFTQFGVDGMFSMSDQHYFMIRCDACNHWQFPLFTPEFIHIPNLPSAINDLLEIDIQMIDSYNLGVSESYVCCQRCRAPLDLGREDNRAWVPKYPSRTGTRGFKINPFSTSTRPVADIIQELTQYKKKDFIRGFKNSVLGEAEDSSTARMSEEDIRYCINQGSGSKPPTPRRDIPAWIGVDMGHTCHVTVGLGYSSDKTSVVEMIKLPIEKLLETVKELLDRYAVVGGMVDRHPESQVAAALRDVSHGRILPCEYRGTKEFNLVKDPKGDISHCQAERTTLLDEVAKVVRTGKISLSGFGGLQAEVITHLRNMVRVEEPETPAVWKKLDNEDHFFHSLAFMLGAMNLKTIQNVTTMAPQVAVGVWGVETQHNGKELIGRKNDRKSSLGTQHYLGL